MMFMQRKLKILKAKIKNILIIRPDAIGDCILITPAISALKQEFPQAKIYILAQELTKAVFSTNPDIEQVFTDKNAIEKQTAMEIELGKSLIELRKEMNFEEAQRFFSKFPKNNRKFTPIRPFSKRRNK